MVAVLFPRTGISKTEDGEGAGHGNKHYPERPPNVQDLSDGGAPFGSGTFSLSRYRLGRSHTCAKTPTIPSHTPWPLFSSSSTVFLSSTHESVPEVRPLLREADGHHHPVPVKRMLHQVVTDLDQSKKVRVRGARAGKFYDCQDASERRGGGGDPKASQHTTVEGLRDVHARPPFSRLERQAVTKQHVCRGGGGGHRGRGRGENLCLCLPAAVEPVTSIEGKHWRKAHSVETTAGCKKTPHLRLLAHPE